MSCPPPWTPLLDSCLKAVEKLPTFTFCTVSHNRIPHARTCVSRGWLFDDKSTGVLVFTTDMRMQKVSDLNETNDAYEACFYFPNKSTQIRLSGFAQLLSPNHTPQLSSTLPLSQPVKSSPPSSGSSSRSGSPSGNPGSPNPNNSSAPVAVPDSSSNNTANNEAKGTSSSPSETILAPLASAATSRKHLPRSYYPVITPSYDPSTDYDSIFPPPTAEEWLNEYNRLWSSMSPRMKKTFKYPTPKSLLDGSTTKALDSISRGVDGASEDSGKEHFVVVLMLVNQVDIVVDESIGRRTLFTRVRYDEWKEQDLSP
ncbi:hypothetical protein AWJ20_4804 [Sugiyamaella lignohabitans]|uniref:Pyridoxamine 5'-phosphate oxidase Alr4036 family FMN-binding domain-containing protein n=1 Tax=Sugiyamaella lignohabitans TaxID=796027 RepID=A0A167EAX8_9ASCO|nr:uncharacterized protein AWJ20_4804 [Sugiyamaella lignohabitans]ANB13853.1 hypothetical protein AWJ20_4804 [Sugiyamaella lignohabitans]